METRDNLGMCYDRLLIGDVILNYKVDEPACSVPAYIGFLVILKTKLFVRDEFESIR